MKTAKCCNVHFGSLKNYLTKDHQLSTDTATVTVTVLRPGEPSLV